MAWEQEGGTVAAQRVATGAAEATAPRKTDEKSKRAFEPFAVSEQDTIGSFGGPVNNSTLRGALIFGLLFAWRFLVVFFPGSFSPVVAFDDAGFVEQNLFFATELAAYLVLMLCCQLIRRIERLACVALACACVALMAKTVAGAVGADVVTMRVFSVAVSVTGGLGFAFGLGFWAVLFAAKRGHTSVQVAGGMLASGVFAALLVAVPYPLAPCLLALLPVALGYLLMSGKRRLARADIPVNAHTTFEPTLHVVSLRLVLALVAVGFAYGLAIGFAAGVSPLDGALFFDASVAALAANLLVGGGILAYALKTGFNFGYSAASVVVLPLAILGQVGLAVYGQEQLGVSVLLLRAALLMFDCMLWMQLPKVFEQVKGLRGFFLLRLALACSMFAGYILQVFLADIAPMFFKEISLLSITVVIVTLTVAFQGEGAVTVWDLMPLPAPSVGGAFRKACAAVKDEHGLTKREYEVMRLVARGRNGAYIQDKLCIALGTFQTHMRNIYKKLDVHSNQELIDLIEEHLER